MEKDWNQRSESLAAEKTPTTVNKTQTQTTSNRCRMTSRARPAIAPTCRNPAAAPLTGTASRRGSRTRERSAGRSRSWLRRSRPRVSHLPIPGSVPGEPHYVAVSPIDFLVEKHAARRWLPNDTDEIADRCTASTRPALSASTSLALWIRLVHVNAPTSRPVDELRVMIRTWPHAARLSSLDEKRAADTPVGQGVGIQHVGELPSQMITILGVRPGISAVAGLPLILTGSWLPTSPDRECAC